MGITQYISQSSICFGSIQIDTPGRYILTENLVFDIPAELSTYFDEYSQNHIFGHFAGIVINTDDVEIDLMGFTIEMSPRFYIIQRFFSLIQLNIFPFIPTVGTTQAKCRHACVKPQGPIFGASICNFHYSKNIRIHNGNLGLTSHSAVHGNGNSNIVLENLHVTQFEVSAFTLNNVQGFVCSDIDIEKNVSPPILPMFSSILYARQTLKQVIRNALNMKTYTCQIHVDYIDTLVRDELPKYSQLDMLVSSILEKLSMHNQSLDAISKHIREDVELAPFFNQDMLSPCTVFGISATGKGASIHEFASKTINDTDTSSNVMLRNVNIRGLRARVNESHVVGRLDVSSPLTLIAGTVFHPSDLIDTHMRLVLCAIEEVARGTDSLPSTSTTALGHGLHIDELSCLLDQSQSMEMQDVMTLLQNKGFTTKRGLDMMGHVTKGVIGIRLDNVQDALCQHVCVSALSNDGAQLADTTPFTESNVFSPSTFKGGASIGFIASQSSRILCKDVHVLNIQSVYSFGAGIIINNESKDITLECVTLHKITSNPSIHDSSLLAIDEKCTRIIVSHVQYNTETYGFYTNYVLRKRDQCDVAQKKTCTHRPCSCGRGCFINGFPM